MVELLKEDFNFFIVTSDRDLGDREPYTNVKVNEWIAGNGHSIIYTSPGTLNLRKVREIIDNIQPSAVYMNSMFSPVYTLRPLWVLQKMKYRGKFIVAPRGMLKKTALGQKPLKKRLFLLLSSFFGFNRRILFHVMDQQEKLEVERQFGKSAGIQLAPNIPSAPIKPANRTKAPGELRIVYISRVHPIKNLMFALEVLRQLPDKKGIQFDIYGAVDDEAYYRKCFEAARTLENRLSVQFLGEIEHNDVHQVLQQYHLFFLPTQGENFGHSIFEALASGCPVLISDQTPWIDVEKFGAGWALPCKDERKFVDVIRGLHNMAQEDYVKLSTGAFDYALKFFQKTDYRKHYRDLFTTASE